ncbi:hypothetical protein XENTR_v10021721 [Xenopus tropicalis]|nr:hypothetical protein XENTR_v10021721 [Xenopus tropicalis]
MMLQKPPSIARGSGRCVVSCRLSAMLVGGVCSLKLLLPFQLLSWESLTHSSKGYPPALCICAPSHQHEQYNQLTRTRSA